MSDIPELVLPPMEMSDIPKPVPPTREWLEKNSSVYLPVKISDIPKPS
jgi:hypothetical protein